MKEFESRVALVTGGSSGIGMETCKMLAERGAAVAIHYNRSREAAEKLAAELRAMGVQAITVQADVTKRDEAHRMVAQVRKELGKIDLLVNNAGNILGRVKIVDETGDLWQRTLDLNLTSMLWVTQVAVQDMLAQRKQLLGGGALRRHFRCSGLRSVQSGRYGSDQIHGEGVRPEQCQRQLCAARLDRHTVPRQSQHWRPEPFCRYSHYRAYWHTSRGGIGDRVLAV